MMRTKSTSDLKVIISDIDNTLIHPFDPDQDQQDLLRGELMEIDRRNFINREVVESLRRISDLGIPLILATTRRITTYRNISSYFTPLFAIVEDGCVILDERGQIDRTWLSRLKDFVGPPDQLDRNLHHQGILWQFKTYLSQRQNPEAFTVVDDGFMASFKVELPFRIEESTPDDIRKYLAGKGVNIPSDLKISVNTKYDSVAVIPKLAGKAQAADYLLHKMGLRLKNVAVLGDDLNDEELLATAGYPLTLASAQPKIKNLVRSRGGVVVPAGRHAGTKAMIDRLMQAIGAN